MERLDGMEEYKKLIKGAKSGCNNPFSNIFFWTKDLEGYIKDGRLYYEENHAGILFFLDEGNYYKMSMYVDMSTHFSVASREKKILLRNMFKEKKEDWKSVESTLGENGFYHAGSVLQIQADVKEVSEKSDKVKKYISFMNKKGYRCVAADEDMYAEVKDLIARSPIIKDYHIDYRTPKETVEDLAQGACLCIVDEQGHVCAGSYAFINNSIAEGVAIVIDEQYKMNGFAPVLTYERCRLLSERGIKYLRGWVLTDNDASLKYHKSMGYQSTGIYADEWILNKK